MDEEPWRRMLGSGTMEDELRRKNHFGATMEEEEWRRSDRPVDIW